MKRIAAAVYPFESGFTSDKQLPVSTLVGTEMRQHSRDFSGSSFHYAIFLVRIFCRALACDCGWHIFTGERRIPVTSERARQVNLLKTATLRCARISFCVSESRLQSSRASGSGPGRKLFPKSSSLLRERVTFWQCGRKRS